MSKIKMRCMTCGKWFQSANAKEVTCPDCMQKARKEKMAAKTVPPTPNKTAGQAAQGATRPTSPSPKPKPASGGTSHWLDTFHDVKVGEPDQPPHPKLPSSPAPREQRSGPERTGYREGGTRGPAGYREREGEHHGPAAYRVGDISGGLGQRPRQPMEPGISRGPRPGGPGEPRPEKRHPDGKPAKARAPKPPAPPKPKREKIPPPPPFKPTPEQIEQVETRYLELAVPAEYDGIRTQIAKELNIPKKAVKQIVKELRERQSIPSWWELQTYKGDSEELAKIKALYEPYLPLPPIGVHKTIAEALSIKPGDVYQAIKLIREEMSLPQYNDPTLHGLDPASLKKKGELQEAEKTESHPTAELSPTATGVSPDSDGVKADSQGEGKAESHSIAELSATAAEMPPGSEDSAKATETTEAAPAAVNSEGGTAE